MFFIWLQNSWGQQKIAVESLPGDCNACHKNGKVLSKGHPITTKMDMKTCKTCHKDEPVEGKTLSSLSGKIPLSHMHMLRGITCKVCHETEIKTLNTENCIACHKDYNVKTNKINPSLPKVHDTHMGELSCNLCHKIHGKSVNFCAQCHDWHYMASR